MIFRGNVGLSIVGNTINCTGDSGIVLNGCSDVYTAMNNFTNCEGLTILEN